MSVKSAVFVNNTRDFFYIRVFEKSCLLQETAKCANNLH